MPTDVLEVADHARAVTVLGDIGGTEAVGAWHVLWTHSNCEQAVHDYLARRGFQLFLPKIEMWSRRGGIRHRARLPLFPGYLFLRHAMDKRSYIEVCKAAGLVRVLGERWDRLAVVPDRQIDSIQAVLQSRVPVMPHPALRQGQRVRITRGPLTDVEGILIRVKANKGLLVLGVELLHRGVAVEVDCTAVTPA